MALTVPEAQQGKSSAASTTLATGVFATSPNAGDTILVLYATEVTAITHTAPTDSAGNTGTAIGTQSQQSGGTALGLSSWIFENLATGTGLSSYKVTAHWTSTAGTVIAIRLAGTLTPTSYNGDIVTNSTTTVSTGANPSVGPTTVIPAANSIFFGVLVSGSAGNAAYTDGTNIAWTHITNEVQTDNTTFDNLYVEHFIETGGSTTKQTAQWTGANFNWFARVFSLAPSVAGAAFLAAPTHPMLQAVSRATNW